MTMPGPQPLLLALLSLPLFYFMLAGARTFERALGDDIGAFLAQASFMSGALGVWFIGFHSPIGLANGAAAGILLLCSVLLYEWARHTIWDRRFYIAWSGEAPAALCDTGPYAHIRHPLYAAYILAFLAVFVALPRWTTLALAAVNAALFVHAAFSDERAIARSPLTASYALYRRRVGMFLPRRVRSRGGG